MWIIIDIDRAVFIDGKNYDKQEQLILNNLPAYKVGCHKLLQDNTPWASLYKRNLTTDLKEKCIMYCKRPLWVDVLLRM